MTQNRVPGAPSRLLGLAGLLALAQAATAQPRSPAEVFGFEPGADYKLASYEQMESYYSQLAAQSDRVRLRRIGETVEGREMYLLIISSTENLNNLDELKAISRTLARARVGPNEARRLAGQGKAVVWIDAGLHATEMAHGQMAPLLAHRLAAEDNAEMRHIRENVVTLLMPMMNPDGLEIVRKWYEQQIGTPYEATSPPELYHHYIGHDNNRDWFMMNMPESQAVSDVVYNGWHPQIVFNHHQISPPYARIVIPPYSDPVNPKIHPGVTTALNEVGNAMGRRFALADMPGAIADVGFDMWWNGGMRTTPYYHNMVGILTETGHNWPSPMLFDPEKFPQMRAYRSLRRPIELLEGIEEMPGTRVDYPYPWPGGESHFRAPMDYMITGTMAVLKLAADKPDEYLHNIHRMGRAAIRKGEAAETRYYVIPARQRNFAEARHLVNTLYWGGIAIARAEGDFELGGKRYAAGSFIIDAAQAFRPHLLDMLERQDYPSLTQYPGGPPDDPYDITGWTLPLQMAVKVERATGPVIVETSPIEGPTAVPPGTVAPESSVAYALAGDSNASLKAVNDLLRAGAEVRRVGETFDIDGVPHKRGSFIVPAEEVDRATLQGAARAHGIDFVALDALPDVQGTTLRLPTVGIYQSYVASEDEGWTRWVFERYGFDTRSLNDEDLRALDGLKGIDAVVIPEQEGTPPGEGVNSTLLNGYPYGMMPAAYSQGIGLEGILNIKRFVEEGGVLLTFGSASRFAIETLGLPVRDIAADFATRDFFIPGTLLAAKAGADDPATAGLPRDLVVNFVRGGAYALKNYDELRALGRGKVLRQAEAPPAPVDFIVRYGEAEGLVKSGWARGEDLIAGKGAMVRVGLGEGAVLLYGFRPQFRGQSRGTYKLVFNPIYEAAAN